MAVPAISGIDADGRLVVFVNGGFAHVPVQSILSQATASAAVDVLGSVVTANATATVPAGWAIDSVFFVNTTANPVIVKIGTTSGATDVVEAVQIGANAIVDTLQSLDFMLRKRLFSKTIDQTVFIQSDNWNGAVLDIAIKRSKIF